MLTSKCSIKKRITAFLIDFVLILLTSLFLEFLVCLPIANNSFSYGEKQIELTIEKVESNLFVFVDDKYEVIVDGDDEKGDIVSSFLYGQKLINIKEYIYMNEYVGSETYILYLHKFYNLIESDSFTKLKEESNYFTDIKLSIFIDEISEEKRIEFCDKVFLQADKDVINYHEGIINSLQADVYMIQLSVEIISFAIPMIIFLYIIPLTNKYRSSIGKKIMKLGVINKFYVPCNALLLTTRFLAFMLVEVLLSLFVIGVPIVLSFVMTLIFKNGQSLHDLLSTTMVHDLSEMMPFEKIEDYAEFIKKEKEIRDRSLRRPYEN